MQDPNPHTFFWSALEATTQAAADEARRNAVDRTGVDTQVVSTSSSVTDVVVFDQDYTTYCFATWHTPATDGLAGLAVCTGLTTNNRCERHEVRFDLSWMSAAPGARVSTACHEFGHTLGLEHRAEGCIRNDDVFPNDYSEHDVAHLNGGYRRLYPNWRLNPGQQMKSWNGRWTVIMQNDGNLVMRDSNWNPVWDSGTCCYPGQGIYAIMQPDANLVVIWPSAYGASVMCHTDTWRSTDNSYLEDQDDGNLVIYTPSRTPVVDRYSGTLRCRP